MNGTTQGASRGWSITAGILLMILGLITLGAQTFTGFATILFFGWVLIIGGFVQIFNGFFSRGERTVSFVGGLLTLIVGAIIVANPAFTAATVTLLISLLLIVTGVYYILSSFAVRNRNWGWSLIGGALTLALGVVILTGWPVTGIAAIGLFVGLAFFINGFFMVVGAFERAEVREVELRRTTTMAGAKGGRAKKKEETKKVEKKKEMEERESDDRRN